MSPIISSLSNNWTSSGGEAPLILPGNDDELYYVANNYAAKANSSFNGWDWSISFTTNTSFPATMGDVIASPDGTLWGYTSQGSYIKAFKLSDGTQGSQAQLNQTIRGLCTSRNGYAVIFNGSGILVCSINNSGSWSLVSSGLGSLGTVESCVSPPPYSTSDLGDKTNLGSTGDSNGAAKIAFVDKNNSGGSCLRTININANGTMSNYQSSSSTGLDGFVSYYPNGDIAFLEQQVSSSNSVMRRFYNGNVSMSGTYGAFWPFAPGVNEQVQHFQPTPDGRFVASFRYDGGLTAYNIWESNKYTDSDPYGYNKSDQYSGTSALMYINGMAFSGGKFWWCGYEDGKQMWYRSLSGTSIDWTGNPSSLAAPSSWSGSAVGMVALTGRPKWAEYDHALNQW